MEIKGNRRDIALFDLAIDSKLRACDLVSAPELWRAESVDVRYGWKADIQNMPADAVRTTDARGRTRSWWLRFFVLAPGRPNCLPKALRISRRPAAVPVSNWGVHDVIFSSDANAFPNIDSFECKTVDITGTVQMYPYRPEIILTSPSSIRTE